MVINHQALRPREKQRFPLTQTIDIGRVCADACHMCDTNVSRSLGSGHSVQQFIRSQKPVDTLDLARDKRMNTLAHGLQIQHERHHRTQSITIRKLVGEKKDITRIANPRCNDVEVNFAHESVGSFFSFFSSSVSSSTAVYRSTSQCESRSRVASWGRPS